MTPRRTPRLLFVLVWLAACAGRAKAPPVASAPVASSAPVVEPKVLGRSCAEALGDERALPQNEQLALTHDRALLAALAGCERYLFERGGKKLRDAAGDALPLYAIPDAALADLPPVEVQSYISLLNRFALLGDLRRQLHYGPRLRAWFDRIAAGKDCDALTREAVIYFSATPESLGGSTATAQKLGARCPEPRASPP